MNMFSRDFNLFKMTQPVNSGDPMDRRRSKLGLSHLFSVALTVFLPCWLLANEPPPSVELDAFTEIFTAGDNDLDYWMLTFVPDGSTNYYAAYGETITDFPTDPAGGTPIPLGDDSFEQIALTNGASLNLYGIAYDRFYVSDNGYITFGEGDDAWSESLANHFRLPRISGVFDDLNPGWDANISWMQLADRVVVTYDSVQVYNAAQPNSFQIEHFFDGTIRIAYLEIGSTGGLAGLSAGLGLPSDFVESNLSGYGPPPLDDLYILPVENFNSSGLIGGPFSPTNALYTLRNVGQTALDWSSEWNATWLALAPAGGTLAAGATVEITVAIGAEAATLASGSYVESIAFSNLVSGFTQLLAVNLEVLALPGEIAVTDSIVPQTDHALPFGQQLVGQQRTEQIRVQNNSFDHDLVLKQIDFQSKYTPLEFAEGQAQAWLPGDPAQWTVENGDYRAQNLGGGDARMISTYTNRTWSDGSYSATIRRTGGLNSVTALFVRASPDFTWNQMGSAYGVGLSGNGDFWVARFNGSEENFLTQGWSFSPYLHNGETPNDVVFNLQGSNIQLFFNGNLAWEGTDSTILVPGRVVLAGYSEATDPTVHYFSDISVSLPSSDDFHFENLPTLPATLPPGASLLFDVVFSPSAPALHQGIVAITSNDPDTPVVAVELSGESLIDWLDLQLGDPLVTSGYAGGVFTPASKSYTLANAVSTAIAWSAVSTDPWVSINPTAGTLVNNAETEIIISINDQANALPPGCYTNTVTLTDEATGYTHERQVILTVIAAPGQITVVDSLVPTADRAMPFGPVIVGLQQTERLRISNTAFTGALEISQITLSSDQHFRIEGLPTLPLTLAPGESKVFDVVCVPTSPGTCASTLRIVSNAIEEPQLEIALTCQGVADALAVTPDSPFSPIGFIGEAITPNSYSYTLSNSSQEPVSWEVNHNAVWLNLMPANGSLAPGATTTVTLTLTPEANSLPAGGYPATISFHNLSSGVICDRDALLELKIRLSAAVNQPWWQLQTGGSSEWFGQADDSHDGLAAGRSGITDHRGATWMEAEVTGPGTLSFWWKVSSERNYDKLQFSVNGTQKDDISGEVDWQLKSYVLAEGPQILRWNYTKDSSASNGSDCGWVDQIVWQADNPSVKIGSFDLVDGQYELVVASDSTDIGSVEVLFRTNLTSGLDWAPLPQQSVTYQGYGQFRIQFPMPDTPCGFFKIIGLEVN